MVFRIAAVVLLFACLVATAPGQTITGSFPAAGGPISLTASGGTVNSSGFDFISAGGNLVPVPNDNATPFQFMLSNSANQVTYGNLGSTVALNGTTQLSVGAKPCADDIIGSWGDGTSPVAFPVTPQGPGCGNVVLREVTEFSVFDFNMTLPGAAIEGLGESGAISIENSGPGTVLLTRTADDGSEGELSMNLPISVSHEASSNVWAAQLEFSVPIDPEPETGMVRAGVSLTGDSGLVGLTPNPDGPWPPEVWIHVPHLWIMDPWPLRDAFDEVALPLGKTVEFSVFTDSSLTEEVEGVELIWGTDGNVDPTSVHTVAFDLEQPVGTFQATVVPEPSSLLLLAIGAILGVGRKRHSRQLDRV